MPSAAANTDTMDFADNKPIFKQIADYCRSRILSGEWAPESRIPSTKELAVTLAVNNRTVMKAYDEMDAAGVIFQKRGLGYFVSADGVGRVRALLASEFLEVTLPEFRRQMQLAGLTPADVLPLL